MSQNWLTGKSASVDLFDIPISSIHENDDLPELVAALVSYDAHDWQVAKVGLAPIAKTGNRLAIFKFANTLSNLGEVKAAEHFWRIAVAGGDTNAGINLANLLKNENRNHEEIVGLYQAAIDDGNIDAIRNLGLYIEDADPDGAEALYLQAVDAGDAKSCANLALKYFNEGDVDNAFEYANLGFERGSMYAATSIALHHMHREEWALTLDAARRALTIATPENVDDQKHPHKMIVIALINLRRFDEAEKAIQVCIDHDVPDTDEMLDWLNLSREAYAGEAVAAPQPSNLATSAPKFCTQCGSSLSPGAAFCGRCGVKLEKVEPRETSFENKCRILSEIWLENRNDKGFEDFVAYNDIGLPLAYCLANGIVETTEKATSFVNEAFTLLLEHLGFESDGGFESFEEIFKAAEVFDLD